MKCIFYDFRRAITGRWFFVAFFASVASLYMSIGNQSYYLINMLAQILGVSIRKAYDLCEKTTDFKVMRLGKRCLRIHKESFDQWLNRQVELS